MNLSVYEFIFEEKLSGSQIEGLTLLMDNMENDPNIKDVRHAAYMFATVKHECANTYLPIKEYGPNSYFDKYEPGTPIGNRLGNKNPGDGLKFKGRGYVQITGLYNYDRLGKAIMVDLVNRPDAALEPDNAYKIMSVGMVRGMFTGRRLDQYINTEKCDYIGARRIINGQDRAGLIAGYAEKFEEWLTSWQHPEL